MGLEEAPGAAGSGRAGAQRSEATGRQAGPSRSPAGKRGVLYSEDIPSLPLLPSSSTYIGIFHGAVPLHHLAFPVNEELWE